MNRMRPTKKYGHSLKWTKNQLFFLNHLRQQKRWVNIWNAFLMDKLQQANKGRSVGERIRLLDFIRIHKDDLLKVYQQLLLADRQQLELKAVKACQKKLTIIRANPKALLHDVNAIFTAMDQDVKWTKSLCPCEFTNNTWKWTALSTQTGMDGFYVAVRGGCRRLCRAQGVCSEKAEQFSTDILGHEPRNLALKLEAYIISASSVNCQHPPNKLISESHTIIQDELEFILHSNNGSRAIKMNYNNYEKKIVEHYGIALTG
ncbi:hypothetical protein SERLA73DRAFT_156345 [Serpula lacrymans var. lacrymans S7.3]|uniref:Uncharacterized protein n=1 Tax=Serpula lacrymans var. lacrymans (strain S7.3) TaxID=936435 RepID=F8QE30_SERL3|nr:hypothetical protein SERLA73DRAFT_156345 [Serpula lacrymans var. lacrymans S7.3]